MFVTVIGHMVGDVKKDAITFWAGVYGRAFQFPPSIPSTIPGDIIQAEVLYWPLDDPSDVNHASFSTPPLVRWGTGSRECSEGWKATATNLVAETVYGYEIRLKSTFPALMGALNFTRQNLSFRTAPESERKVRVMFSSCQKAGNGKGSRDENQDSWDLVAPNSGGQPTVPVDLNVLLGDTHYANSHQRSNKWEKSWAQFGIERYQEFLAATPTYAIYDDHDFVDNNVGGESDYAKEPTPYGPRRERAARYFDGLWIIPAPDSRTREEGCYHYFTYGGVHFFMLDTIYNKSYDEDDNVTEQQGDILGSKQWAWFNSTLDSLDQNEFKVICSGQTLDRGGWSWKNYEAAQAKLEAALANHPYSLVVSGDIHKVRYYAPDRSWLGKPEVISSGIGYGPGEDNENIDNVGRFAVVEFDPAKKTASYEFYNGRTQGDRRGMPYDSGDIQWTS